VGHSASTKNDRRSRGSFDDITIYHRVLSQEEIEDRTKALLKAAKLKKGRAKNAPSPVLAISGAAKIGTTELLRRAIAVIQETRAKEAEEKSSTIEAAQ